MSTTTRLKILWWETTSNTSCQAINIASYGSSRHQAADLSVVEHSTTSMSAVAVPIKKRKLVSINSTTAATTTTTCIEGGEFDGCTVEKTNGVVAIALTTKTCRDAQRWQSMPSLLAADDDYKSLQVLDIYNSRYIAQIHDSLGQLTQLRSLAIVGCSRLTELPEGIGNLQQLEEVCTRAQEAFLSDGYWIARESHLPFLAFTIQLDLTDTTELQSLPDSICDLKRYGTHGGCSTGTYIHSSNSPPSTSTSSSSSRTQSPTVMFGQCPFQRQQILNTLTLPPRRSLVPDGTHSRQMQSLAVLAHVHWPTLAPSFLADARMQGHRGVAQQSRSLYRSRRTRFEQVHGYHVISERTHGTVDTIGRCHLDEMQESDQLAGGHWPVHRPGVVGSPEL